MVLKIKDQYGNKIDIPALRGPQGPRGEMGPQGPQGEPGGVDNTVLDQHMSDKNNPHGITPEQIPGLTEKINTLIDEKLGVIENGSY